MTPALIAALCLTLCGWPAAAEQCMVLANGIPLEAGLAKCDEAGALLLSAEALQRGLGLTVTEPEGDGPWTVRGFGVTVLVRPEVKAYTVAGKLRRAKSCPVVTDGELWIPLAMVRRAFGVDARMRGENEVTVWTLRGPGVELTEVREGVHREKARLVLEVSRPTAFTWWQEPGRLLIDLPAPDEGGAWSRSVQLLRFDDPLISELRQGPTTGETIRVEIVHGSSRPPRIFSLAEPPRVVVDLFRDPEDIAPEPGPPMLPPLPGAAGVLHTRNFCTARGPVRVFVLEVDPRSERIDVRPALASATVHERATVTRMVASTGAYGGINGGFFARSGQPLGMLVIDGEWIREPWGGRTVLGITEDGRVLMDRLEFAAQVAFSGLGTQRLHGINHGPDEMDTLTMYTRRWGQFVVGARQCTRLVVDAAGVVAHKETDGRIVRIPDGGFVLSGNGRMARSLDVVELGTEVEARLGTSPQWPPLRHAIGGGPRLVKDGRTHVTAAPEGFRSDVHATAPSRTAVGVTKQGRLLLVAAQGAGETAGTGMTLQELASTMIKLGAWQAMNVDGGGSTSFVAGGKLLNRPTDGVPRRVSNALLVFVRGCERAESGG
ncbi:MAG: phosphodiester glycosidase family protein [Armatimonadota bacterium]|nr:phosphodiester glycosidase family protein [Armatimonadota bacterium]